MWLNSRNDGFTVVSFTVSPALGLTAPQEAERVALNGLILSDRTLYDYMVRPEIMFPDPNDTLFWNVDGVHLNSNGAQYLGYAVYDNIFKDKNKLKVESNQALSSGNGTDLITNSKIIAPSFSGSATLTGTPTAPTASQGTNTTQIATTAFVTANKDRLIGYTVATLPTGTQGDTAFVTDALAPTYLAVIVGGGAVVTPVFYNGANWVAH